MRNRFRKIILVVVFPFVMNTYSKDLSLADCGGRPDGITLNTEAFARGIATLAAGGGGRLVVPPGLWLTGPIRLASRVELHLERGALVRFSPDYRLYPLRLVTIKGDEWEVVSTSPISGEDLEDIALTGDGIFDGSGEVWRMCKRAKFTADEWKERIASGGVLSADGASWYPDAACLDGERATRALAEKGIRNPAAYEPYHLFLRPKMARFLRCRRLRLDGVTFRNSPMWTLNPLLCEDVEITDVKVFNAASAQNSDGIDIESCRRVKVKGCTLSVGDDGICLKSGLNAVGRRRAAPTEDVEVSGCTVYAGHGGFVIGSEMSGGVRRIVVSNCVFIGTDSGVRFKSTRGRGGRVEDIRLSGLRMADIAGHAIDINLYYAGRAPTEEEISQEVPAAPVTEETPVFRDIRLENIVSVGSRAALVVRGLPEMPVRGLAIIDSRFDGAAEGLTLKYCEAPRLTRLFVNNQEVK